MDVRTTSDLQSGFVGFEYLGKPVIIPARIEATITDVDWDVSFVVQPNEHGEPVITSLAISQKLGGPPVGAQNVRGVRLGAAFTHAIESAAIVGQPNKAGIYYGGNWSGAPIPSGNAPAGFGQFALKRRRPAVTKENLDSAVTAFIKAKATPNVGDIYTAVGDAIGKSRATAARRIDKARQIGLLKDEDTR